MPTSSASLAAQQLATVGYYVAPAVLGEPELAACSARLLQLLPAGAIGPNDAHRVRRPRITAPSYMYSLEGDGSTGPASSASDSSLVWSQDEPGGNPNGRKQMIGEVCDPMLANLGCDQTVRAAVVLQPSLSFIVRAFDSGGSQDDKQGARSARCSPRPLPPSAGPLS